MNTISKIIIAVLSVVVAALLFVIFSPFGKSNTNNNTSPTNTITNNNQTTQSTPAQNQTTFVSNTNTSQAPVAPAAAPAVSEEQAINTALTHAGFDRNTARITSVSLDNHDDFINVLHYDVDFEGINDHYDYEYKIDAQTGEILKNKKELD